MQTCHLCHENENMSEHTQFYLVAYTAKRQKLRN
jgi:hypothetical protein